MKVATVLDNSVPVSMIRRHNGMISVVSRKFTISGSSTYYKEVEMRICGWEMMMDE
jgi:hypothetical protein